MHWRPIMAETLRVLRDTFDRNSEQLKEVETFLSALVKHVYPTEGVVAVPTDRDDNRVLECALKASVWNSARNCAAFRILSENSVESRNG